MNCKPRAFSALALLTLAGLLLPGALAAQDFRNSPSHSDSLSPAPARTGITPPDTSAANPFLVYTAVPDSGEDPQPSGPSAAPASPWDKDEDSWRVDVYPVYAWAPVMGADVKLPEQPSSPGSGGGGGEVIPSGSTSGSFNGAAFAGAEVFKSHISLAGSFLWAGLSGDRTVPRVHVGMHFVYGQILAGFAVWKGLSAEAGVRRIAFHVSAEVADYPEVSRTPGVWDPIIGATYRYRLSKKWRVQGHFDGGGFGVGSDVDLLAGARADWRFANHFGMAMGVAAQRFKISNTRLNQTLTVDQTLWGPLFGFGMYF